MTLEVGEASFVAHRVVLSACSTYFSNILNRLSDCPHPVIVLRDTTPRQMKALLDYMYTGEMSVKQEVGLFFKYSGDLNTGYLLTGNI